MSEIEDAQRPLVEKHPLTDPAKSRNGWAWCRNPRCRRPHQIWDVNGSRVATMDGETLQRQYPGKVPPEVTRR